MVSQHHTVLDVATTTTTFLLDVTESLARDLAPTGRLLVWYFNDPIGRSEMIVDSISLNVDGIFANDVRTGEFNSSLGKTDVRTGDVKVP